MNNELYHYNTNHDELGRFAKSSGGGGSIISKSSAGGGNAISRYFQEKQARKEAIKERKRAIKNIRMMSDAELQKHIQRMRAEKEFKTLAGEDLSKGKSMV